MNFRTFLYIAILIILYGIIHYLSSSKYDFDEKGYVRENRYTGAVEEFVENKWRRM